MAQRMWTSALQLRGREFCFILNDTVREDTPAMAGTLGAKKNAFFGAMVL